MTEMVEKQSFLIYLILVTNMIYAFIATQRVSSVKQETEAIRGCHGMLLDDMDLWREKLNNNNALFPKGRHTEYICWVYYGLFYFQGKKWA